MLKGTISRPLHEKGYSFIKPDTGGRDVFVHVNALVSGTESDIAPGVRVAYEMGTNREGKEQARSVRILPAADTEEDNSRYQEYGEEISYDWHREVSEMAAAARELTERLDKLADALQPE